MSDRSVTLAAVVAAGLAACGHATTAPRPQPPAPATVTQGPTGSILSTAPSGLLRPGAERLIQQRLVALKQLDSAGVSGRLDAETQSALARFQSSHGLARTGLPGYETVKRLGLSTERVFRVPGSPAGSGKTCGTDGRSPAK